MVSEASGGVRTHGSPESCRPERGFVRPSGLGGQKSSAANVDMFCFVWISGKTVKFVKNRFI